MASWSGQRVRHSMEHYLQASFLTKQACYVSPAHTLFGMFGLNVPHAYYSGKPQMVFSPASNQLLAPKALISSAGTGDREYVE
eukprot:jgi/Botrbrau1/9729/Bobra.0388s0021.1